MVKEKMFREVTENDKFEGCVLSVFDNSVPESIRLNECTYDEEGNYVQKCTGRFRICEVLEDGMDSAKLAHNVKEICHTIIDVVNPGFSEMGYPEIAIEPEVAKIFATYVNN